MKINTNMKRGDILNFFNIPLFVILIFNIENGKENFRTNAKIFLFQLKLRILARAIGCFKCVSAGGDNPSCEVRISEN